MWTHFFLHCYFLNKALKIQFSSLLVGIWVTSSSELWYSGDMIIICQCVCFFLQAVSHSVGKMLILSISSPLLWKRVLLFSLSTCLLWALGPWARPDWPVRGLHVFVTKAKSCHFTNTEDSWKDKFLSFELWILRIQAWTKIYLASIFWGTKYYHGCEYFIISMYTSLDIFNPVNSTQVSGYVELEGLRGKLRLGWSSA